MKEECYFLSFLHKYCTDNKKNTKEYTNINYPPDFEKCYEFLFYTTKISFLKDCNFPFLSKPLTPF